MKNLIYKILILSISLTVLSCNVDDDDGTNSDLPDITTEGAHTFGCKINGQVFLPKISCKGFNCPPVSELRLSYFQKDDKYQFGLSALNDINGDVYISLELYLDEPLEKRVYELSESYIASIDRIWPNASSNINKKIRGEYINSSFATNSEITGTLEITEISTSGERFISGIFEFQAINQQGEIVNFTDGRFDTRVYYSNLF